MPACGEPCRRHTTMTGSCRRRALPKGCWTDLTTSYRRRLGCGRAPCAPRDPPRIGRTGRRHPDPRCPPIVSRQPRYCPGDLAHRDLSLRRGGPDPRRREDVRPPNTTPGAGLVNIRYAELTVMALQLIPSVADPDTALPRRSRTPAAAAESISARWPADIPARPVWCRRDNHPDRL